MNNISIACDHAGFELKTEIVKMLQIMHYEVQDFGTNSLQSMDYPDVVHPFAASINNHIKGILICGSGNGVCMTANKYSYIRAALCWNNELASLSRQHNDANVLCIPARFVSTETAKEMVKVFLETPFEGGRHINRVKKIEISS